MPQIFQVLRCYKCSVFQVHQTKKSNKFDCKLCGEKKQSVKRHYGIGTAKDCRLHVQKLNGIRGEIEELKESKQPESDEENSPVNNIVQSCPDTKNKSKWSDYVDTKEVEVTQHLLESQPMYLNDTEVVLERPKKLRKVEFRCPNLNKTTETIDNINFTESITHSDLATSSKSNDNTKPNNNEPKNYVKKYIPPAIITKKKVNVIVPPTATAKQTNSNSKWAQFVEEENKDVPDDKNLYLNEDEECSDEDEFLDIQSKNSKALFALCDDSELDNVLDI